MRAVDLGVPWREALADHVERDRATPIWRERSRCSRGRRRSGSRCATRPASSPRTVRDARRAATLERARTAPVKMLFPLVFLILPAFLLLTVVPVLITTVRSID